MRSKKIVEALIQEYTDMLDDILRWLYHDQVHRELEQSASDGFRFVYAEALRDYFSDSRKQIPAA